MKVLLIVPTYQYKHHYPSFMPFMLFPTGLAYLASYLKSTGHTVVGFNPNNIVGYSSASSMLEDQLTKSINSSKPDLIGIGGLCTDYSFIRDSIDIVRRLNPSIPIVLGGGIVTNDAQFITKTLKPDFSILGEGEEILSILVSRLESGSTDYSDIPNLVYWKDSRLVYTLQDYTYPNLDSRPFPDYEPFGVSKMMGEYTNTLAWWYRYTRPYPRTWTLITARSCPFSCTFCVHSRGPKYRSRSISTVIEEIAYSYTKYNFNILVILDELFAVNKARMLEFCSALENAKKLYGWNFDWIFSTHASSNLDRETLQLAKSTGCSGFGYGVESASPRVLSSMNKKTTPSQITKAIELANATGLTFSGNLIFGDPAETEETVLESLKFMTTNCRSVNIMLASLRPYPGSRIYDYCLEKGIIKDKLEFYEHIDENPWNMLHNMTSVPSKRWLPLLDTIVTYGQLSPWTKESVASSFSEDDTEDSALTKYTGKKMYKVVSSCPYCGQTMYHRELLYLDSGKSTAVSSSKKTELVYSLSLYRDAVLKAVRLLTLYYFSYINSIYRLMRSTTRQKGNLIWKSFFSTVFFNTGCPNCGKKVKVTIPIPFSLKVFSYSELRRRFLLV